MTLFTSSQILRIFPHNFFNNRNDWTEKMEIYKFEYIRDEAGFANKKSIFYIFERASDRLLMFWYSERNL